MQKKVAVIGAGAMGLAAAHYAIELGHDVTVFEASPEAGGMAAHFDFDGLSIERFYHFVCKADQPLFNLLRELDMEEKMLWRDTGMGFFFDGTLHKWGDPLSLLRFPHLSWLSKFRYGLHAFFSTRRSDWSRLDGLFAHEWLRKWVGDEAFRICWEKLFDLKFYQYKDQISAAWIWTRIKRVGTSRKSLFQEQLGYIEGGSETLIKALVKRIETAGGKVHLNSPVQRIVLNEQKDQIHGLEINNEVLSFDEIISTAAIPHIVDTLQELPNETVEQYRRLPNIGVVCVVHKLRKSITDYFWLNINDDRMHIPGIVEFSRLRPMGDDHVVYIPYYVPITNEIFQRPDETFVEETKVYLKQINPQLTDEDFISCRIGRLKFAQPICGPNFLSDLPNLSPNVKGLQIADTSYYYPEDRGISEGIRLAKEMAANVS